ncbi:MAG: hypothetical protein JWS12_632 [Candidatus Saccharibacteria bacterium]|nr:hypothetical protein [Candidatus Saccharibacteria bacterium]
MTISDKEFEEIVTQAIDKLPEKYGQRLKNVAFVIEDDPTEEQRQQLHLYNGQTLFGLYQGVPLTRRGSGYNLVLPDKITLFKNPLSATCFTLAQLKERVYHTIWHEVAHYFGLDHTDIAKRER